MKSGSRSEDLRGADRPGEADAGPGRGSGSRRRRAPARAGVSPVMGQYFEAKKAHPDCLLFFRMGDFYELFFDDALKASAALDIALTRRGKHEGEDIPMCGVPVHSHEGYLERLIRAGFKVAVCEQVEDPAEARKRGYKAIVRREVVRVITPGTLTEESLLDARRSNYLASLAKAESRLALAWLDMSTGDVSVTEVVRETLDAELSRLSPGELLLSEGLLQEPGLFEILGAWKPALTPQPASLFDSQSAERRLKELYGVQALDAFGAFERAELAALGALVGYLELTQKGRLPRLARPRLVSADATMTIDSATRRNLELTDSLSGARLGSLLGVIERTVTGAGGRLLLAWLSAPLTDPDAINRRLDVVAFFAGQEPVRATARAALKRCPDIERALSRLTLGRGSPRDLGAIREALARVPELRETISSGASEGPAPEALPQRLEALIGELGHHAPLVDRLASALVPEPPVFARDGGFIAKGYAPQLDELRLLRDESRRLVLNLESRYREETGIGALKVRHNNVLGYFVEVPSRHAPKMGERFIHRQTLTSAVRYTTVELGELESKISSAADKALALELELFEDLVGEVAARAEEIAKAAKAMAEMDVAAGLAQLAVDNDYVRPLVDDSLAFEVTGGRHPVVEAVGDPTPGASRDAFVANGCDLAEGMRLWLLTGPNMAGKSTFLRQNALIAILAQMGAFVPASAAHIGVVDRLFSRVGASDELARGRSTFMVEMIETAAILNQASPRSLVILDEIGRGTATFDGLSIAWATVEHLHEVNHCRAIFATHFHELTALSSKLKALSCHTMRVKEWKGEVVFLHEVVPGAADRSYGIHVARLAGLPAPVVARAQEVLETLEEGESGGAVARLAEDLPLFAETRARGSDAPPPSAVEEALGSVNADELTPKTALELIYRLKVLLSAASEN